MNAKWVVVACLLMAGTALAQTTAVPGGVNQALGAANPAAVAVPGGINQFTPATATTSGTTGTGGTGQGTVSSITPFVDSGTSLNYGYKATTAGEGYLRGAADVIRADALYGLAGSQAAINYGLARQMNLRTAEEIAQWKTSYQQYLRSLRPPRVTESELVRLARVRLPDRLGVADLDPASGRLAWPSVLTEPAFASLRAEIERLMADRASRQLTLNDYLRLDESIDQLQYQLTQRIRQYPTDLYLTGNRFLNGLRYEATLAPVPATTQIGAAARPTLR